LEDTGTQQGILRPGIPDKYRIKTRLGSGGMCDVYEAEHVLMGKRVAIKVLRAQFAAEPATSQRFEQEARAASRIHHPNAINVMDVGTTTEGSPFIVMELIDGKTLDTVIREDGPMRPERAANILRQAAGAVEAAHRAGIIHRDIKPQNILVSGVDGQDWVKVVDFGVSKTLEDHRGGPSITAANFIVGTPRYMSPEQCEGAHIDARSDVYSLGVVLYEMLAGRPPFEDDSATRLLVRHTSEPPPPLRTRREVSPEVDSVVMSALEKERSRRPQSAAELSRLFDQAVGIGKENQDAGGRGTASQRIEVPLGSDESTIVRPKAASTEAVPARPMSVQTGQSLNRSYSGEEPRGDRIYYYPRKRGDSSGLVITLVGLLVVALGVAAYLYYNGLTSGTDATQDSISSAQQSIADAIARVDSLPSSHSLRAYLPQLEQWQGELRAYSQMPDRTEAMKSAADQYKVKADQISGQAKIAAAALARQANQNTAQPEASVSSSRQPVEQAPPANSGAANREPQRQPEGTTSNANRASPEPPSLLPVKPQLSPSRPANSNSGG
jgi:tRNA A-37 threonylcarbamoyl transferase component Bud32